MHYTNVLLTYLNSLNDIVGFVFFKI